MVIFSGYCPRCSVSYEVPELTQCVSCLEAKNNGEFGNCRRGVNYDQHDPGMECAPCSSALGIGEGNGEDLVAANSTLGGGGGGSSSAPASSSSSSRGSTSGGGEASYSSGKRRRVR